VKEERGPDFPYFWIEKPDMSSLRVLADHLKQKSWAFENQRLSWRNNGNGEANNRANVHNAATGS
jgi:hypothetical protein